MLPIKFQVNWPFGSKEEKNRFSRWLPQRPSGISDQTILATFDLQVTRMLPTKFRIKWPLVQEKKRKIDFQDGCHGGHLGFPIGTILAIFDLQVIPMLPTKFRVIWPFGSGETAKNRFSRWLSSQPPWISNWNDFSYFWSTSHPDASYQVSIGLLAQEKKRKKIFKMATMAATLDFQSERFQLFFICKYPRCFLPSLESNGPRV